MERKAGSCVGRGYSLIDKSQHVNQTRGRLPNLFYMQLQWHVVVNEKLEISCYIKQLKSQKGFKVAVYTEIDVVKLNQSHESREVKIPNFWNQPNTRAA